MRKIKTQEELDKIKRRNAVIIGLTLIFLLVISSLGYSIMSREPEESSFVDYGPYRFFRVSDYWVLKTEELELSFSNLPNELENITLEGEYNLMDYYNEPIYLVNANVGANELLSILGRYALRYQEACINESDCIEDLPLKDCSENVFIFIDSNEENKVYKNESCVYIKGDQIKGVDKLLYALLNING